MSQEFDQIATYLNLLVKHAGGEVRIPFDEAEEGLPAGHGIRVVMNQESEEIVFTLQEIPQPKTDNAEQ